MHIQLCLTLLLLFSNTIECSNERNLLNAVIPNVTQIINKILDNGGNGKNPSYMLRSLVQKSIKENISPFTMYYETEINSDFLETLERISGIFSEAQKNNPGLVPNLLVALKFTYSNKGIHKGTFKILATEALKLAFSYDLTIFADINFICDDNLGGLRRKALKSVNIHGYNGTPTMGYIVGHNNYPCFQKIKPSIGTENLIVETSLELDDAIFVESYRIFKEKLDTKVELTVKNITKAIDLPHPTHSSVYFNLVIKATKNNFTLPQDNKSGNSQMDPYHKTIERYDSLLKRYLAEWSWDKKSGTRIILSYPNLKLAPINYEHSLEWMNFRYSCIPYLTNLPVLNSKVSPSTHPVTFTHSSTLLLEDIASSGFDRVMMNGVHWTKLTTELNNVLTCKSSKCRPNIIYMMDSTEPWSMPLRVSLKKHGSVAGMELKTIVFSYNYPPQNPTYEDILTAFKEINNNSQESLHSACYTWQGNLSIDTTWDNNNISYSIKQVFACPVKNYVSGFVWNVTINILNDDVDKFLQNLMKRLDAFVLARNLLHEGFPGRQVLLIIQTGYSGKVNATEKGVTMYCSPLRERLDQFHEGIFTWAAVNDFPLIIQPVENLSGYADIDNPLVWKKIKSKAPGLIQNVMESGPLFMRRSYNQSKVFGAWVRGTYPCIFKANNQNDIENSILFENDFIGVTLDLNLRRGKTSLSKKEVEILLLFVFQKFSKVYLLISPNHIELISEILGDPTFEEILKVNKGKPGHIFLQTNFLTYDCTELLLQAVRLLKRLHFNVYVSEFFEKYKEPNMLGILLPTLNVERYHVQSNCTELAYNIVKGNRDKDYKYVNNISYLICEIQAFPADNKNSIKMQDFLDTHLYLTKLFHSVYPNLKEIHFHLKPKPSGRNNWKQNRNLLLFLSDVNNFSKSYRINYFLLSAFVDEMHSDQESSYWKITNYTILTNISVFEDIYTKVLNTVTWIPERNFRIDIDRKDDKTSTRCNTNSSMTTENRKASTGLERSTEKGEKGTTVKTSHSKDVIWQRKPANSIENAKHIEIWDLNSSNSQISDTNGSITLTTPKNPAFSTQVISAVAGCAALLVTSLVIICAYRKVTINFLSVKEINTFFNGCTETLQNKGEKGKLGNQKYIGHVFDALVYQKEYEVLKDAIEISTKHSLKEGTFSRAFQAQLKLQECFEDVVVKIPNKCTKPIFKGFLSEIKLLCYIGEHSNLVRFMGCYSKDIKKGLVWIITEYCRFGTLLDYLKHLKSLDSGNLGSQELVRFSQEIADGMEYIFDQNVVHGNLCCKRVLLDQNKICKISGFSLSRRIPEYETYVNENLYDKLPWQWMAPETIKTLQFSKQSDMWSFGVTLWEIFSLGDTPYPWRESWSECFIEDLEKGLRMTSPSYATKEIFEVMQDCWESVPEHRRSMTSLPEYFKGLVKPAFAIDVEEAPQKS